MSHTEELTDEGRQMWENIANYEKLISSKYVTPTEKKVRTKLNIFEIQLLFMRDEIRRMIINSTRVVRDCDDIISTYTSKEEYISSDAKVAKQIHLNLIVRLNRLLEYESVFDEHIELTPDREINTLFYDSFKNR